MSLGDAIAQAIRQDSIKIDDMIDAGICPDCKGDLEVISENTGFEDNENIEFTIVCNVCGKDWTMGSLTEYPDHTQQPRKRRFSLKGKQ
jgi:uncharacterized protein with PIN domain